MLIDESIFHTFYLLNLNAQLKYCKGNASSENTIRENIVKISSKRSKRIKFDLGENHLLKYHGYKEYFCTKLLTPILDGRPILSCSKEPFNILSKDKKDESNVNSMIPPSKFLIAVFVLWSISNNGEIDAEFALSNAGLLNLIIK